MPAPLNSRIEQLQQEIERERAAILQMLNAQTETPFDVEAYRRLYAQALESAGRQELLDRMMDAVNPKEKPHVA
jgi:F0F1-type ATP synthase membrane subunit b/b'